MGAFIAIVGFLTIFIGLVLFIITLFSKTPKTPATVVLIVGFVLLNISSFPKDALYGISGFLALLTGITMLCVYIFKDKPLKIPGIVILIGFLALSSSLFSSPETSSIEDINAQSAIEVEATDQAEKTIESQEPKKITEAKKEEPTEKVIRIGDLLIVNDIHYVINKISTAQNVGGEYGKDAQSQFTIVNITVKNEQNEAITVDSDQFKLTSGERVYEASPSAGIYANEDYDFFYTEVNPGVSVTGNIVFDVPEGLQSTQLHIQTDLWESEKGIVHLQ